jgi:hypothetical protein
MELYRVHKSIVHISIKVIEEKLKNVFLWTSKSEINNISRGKKGVFVFIIYLT